MKNINIDNGKITINTTGYSAEEFAVPVAQTQAQTDFEYVEPVSFEGGFGNPLAFERFKAIMEKREEVNAQPVTEVNFASAPVTEMMPC